MYFYQYQPRSSDGAMSPVKANHSWCLAYGEPLACTGVWLNNNSVAGTGKSSLYKTV